MLILLPSRIVAHPKSQMFKSIYSTHFSFLMLNESMLIFQNLNKKYSFLKHLFQKKVRNCYFAGNYFQLKSNLILDIFRLTFFVYSIFYCNLFFYYICSWHLLRDFLNMKYASRSFIHTSELIGLFIYFSVFIFVTTENILCK